MPAEQGTTFKPRVPPGSVVGRGGVRPAAARPCARDRGSEEFKSDLLRTKITPRLAYAIAGNREPRRTVLDQQYTLTTSVAPTGAGVTAATGWKK